MIDFHDNKLRLDIMDVYLEVDYGYLNRYPVRLRPAQDTQQLPSTSASGVLGRSFHLGDRIQIRQQSTFRPPIGGLAQRR